MKNGALVISLHDVSPRTRPQCERILDELRALGVGACSLLVIADHHHRGHFLEDKNFSQWLRKLSQEGHEIVIHGYFHQRQRRAAESMAARLTTRFYTADEGEFYDIDRASAADLIARARADFKQIGLSPVGFIAPAWLLSAPAEAVLSESGLDYTTRLGTVSDLRSGVRVDSQSLVWSVRSAGRRFLSLGWNLLLYGALHSRNALLRVSIHPVDIDQPPVWQQIRALLASALRHRQPFTYQAWILRQRARAPRAPQHSTPLPTAPFQ